MLLHVSRVLYHINCVKLASIIHKREIQFLIVTWVSKCIKLEANRHANLLPINLPQVSHRLNMSRQNSLRRRGSMPQVVCYVLEEIVKNNEKVTSPVSSRDVLGTIELTLFPIELWSLYRVQS